MKKNFLVKLKESALVKRIKELDSARTFYTVSKLSFVQRLKQLLFFDSFKIVLVLMGFVVFYYFFIASDRYVSKSAISVRATSSQSGSLGVLDSLFRGTSTATNEDLIYLKNYISSLDMLQILDQNINIRSLYEAQRLDLFFRLYSFDDQEAFLKYYKNRVKVIDQGDGLLNLEVEGFTPQQAHQIASAILIQSEKFVNEITHKNAREQLAFAEAELLKYKEKYQEATKALTDFQNEHGVLDPSKETEARVSFIGSMEANLATKEASLLAMQSYINDDAPQMITLKAEIEALKQQLQKEKMRANVSVNSEKLNELLASFQKLTVEAGFAESAYTTALSAFESTRIEAIRKIKQLVIIQSPTLPQSPMYPRKLYNIITIFIALSLIYSTVRLIKTIIEEHKY